MTIWVKICGLTTPDGVTAALDAGADAIGFVFAKSVRQVSADVALRLAAPARGRALCVAVTRHPSQRDIDEIVAVFKPDVLQSDLADLALLRLPTELALMPVFRGAGGENTTTGGDERDGERREDRGAHGRDRAGDDHGKGDDLLTLPPASSSKASPAAPASPATGPPLTA